MITAVWIALGLTTLLHITQQYVEVSAIPKTGSIFLKSQTRHFHYLRSSIQKNVAYNPPEKFLGHLANVNVACFVFISRVQNTLASS